MTRAVLHEYLSEYAARLKLDLQENGSLKVRLLMRHDEDVEFMTKLLGGNANVVYTLVKIVSYVK